MNCGSCNAQTFAVHEGAMDIALVGVPPLRDYGSINYWGRRDDVNNIRLLRSRIAGEQWGWSYESRLRGPHIQIVRRSDDTPVYVWEADSIIDQHRPDYKPIMETDDRGVSIIPDGGSSIACYFPDTTAIESIESDIAAAEVPGWAETTNYYMDNPVKFFNYIWRNEQARHGISIYPTIWEAYKRDHPSKAYDFYTLLWMRCASRVLYGHYGQTCIPLILNNFKVDEIGNIYLP